MDLIWIGAIGLLWAVVVAGACGLSRLDRAPEARP
jgi:hypothetical protein